eukprot:11204623-Lingulodinium_polyedra.AAC.1
MSFQCLQEAQVLNHCLVFGQPWRVSPVSDVAWVSLPDPPLLPPEMANVIKEPPGPALGLPLASFPCK